MGKGKPSRAKTPAAKPPEGVPMVWLGAIGTVAAAGVCGLLFGGNLGGSGASRSAVTVRAIHNGDPIGVGEPGDPSAQPFDHNLTARDFDSAGKQPYAIFSALDGRKLEYVPYLALPLRMHTAHTHPHTDVTYALATHEELVRHCVRRLPGLHHRNFSAVADGMDVVLVPRIPGKHFIWPGYDIGHKFEVADIQHPVPERPVQLEMMVCDPRTLFPSLQQSVGD